MKFTSLGGLVTELELLGWAAQAVHDRMEHALRRFYDDMRGELARELAALADEDFAEIVGRSRETSTHYKWSLMDDPANDFKIWLHEYKDGAHRGSGYARSIHNHRYPLSSLILYGSYKHTKLAIDDMSEQSRRLRITTEQKLDPGSVYTITTNELHSISDIRDHTITLVVQHRTIRSFSISIDPQSLRTIRHYPIEERHVNLRECLEPAGERASGS
ncbi:hypothetical protein [Spirillospora sp. NPDC047279]|uniref:hypothetical protein n=1 Tax=Spirillospora sp. NPDC047279 TaxID=3155478 RepID=UPI0033D82D0D